MLDDPVHRTIPAEQGPAPGALGRMWRSAVAAHGSRPWLIEETSGTVLTYAEADALIRRRLPEPASMVCRRAEPTVEVALSFWAAMRAGAVFVPVDRSLGDAAFRRIADFVAESRGNWPPSADDLAVILFTSGTTGEPKGVELSHGALGRSARLVAETYRFTPDDRLMSLGEFHAMSGLRNPLIATVAAGASCVLLQAGQRRHA
ncbi:MAG TPA: AMP-binding protein, partial [Azospirillaceae bacterium]|nr:AMP-binding protein [Azospirillaceae bacterium]